MDLLIKFCLKLQEGRLKKIFLVILAAVAVANLSFFAFGDEPTSHSKVVAYYFHTTFRCYSCNILEQYAKEAIETNFKNAIDSGNVEFKSINVEDEQHKHFIKDYGLYTKALVISLVKDGKEVRYKNLDKIWELARNKQRFVEYVVVEMEDLIKEIE